MTLLTVEGTKEYTLSFFISPSLCLIISPHFTCSPSSTFSYFVLEKRVYRYLSFIIPLSYAIRRAKTWHNTISTSIISTEQHPNHYYTTYRMHREAYTKVKSIEHQSPISLTSRWISPSTRQQTNPHISTKQLYCNATSPHSIHKSATPRPNNYRSTPTYALA